MTDVAAAAAAAAAPVTNVYRKHDDDDEAMLEDNEDDECVSIKAVTMAKQFSNEQVNPQLLAVYYAKLFPFDLLYQWLSYHSPAVFARREFSMTIEPVPGEEVYLRYQSFGNGSELASMMQQRRPVKLDIGAVFSHAPKMHNTVPSGQFKPVSRELVFDVDLTDYDDVRHCGCSGAHICAVCWQLMTVAVQVMDHGLRTDFGFQHVAWFYSGRRGVHAWVCDATARELTDAGRAAVASYFEVNLGSDKNHDVTLTSPLHPLLSRAVQELEPHFVATHLPSQGHGLLATPERWESLLATLPAAARPVHDIILKTWNSVKCRSTPSEKWTELKAHLAAFLKESQKAGHSKAAARMSGKERAAIENWPAYTVLKYTYPRLDINVSKMRNHLLKSPFCVHPKTGRVCVPLDAKCADQFDPFAVPTLSQLLQELDLQSSDDSGDKTENWKKTSLRPYYDAFERDFLQPLLKAQKAADKGVKEQQAAMNGDF